MHALRRLKNVSGQGGFTLAEILVACAVITLGLIGISAGFGYGVDGVEAGRQQSTAVFLAEQRIEQAKELAARGAQPGRSEHDESSGGGGLRLRSGAPRLPARPRRSPSTPAVPRALEST